MPRRLFHLENIIYNGDEKIVDHSYYNSLTALFEDNKEELGISLSTLQHSDFPYSKNDPPFEWTIYKGLSHSTNEILMHNQAADKLGPESFQ